MDNPVLVLLTIFQGLNASFACTIISGVAFAVLNMVVLFTTAIAVNSSLLSLLAVFCFLVEIADMVGVGFASCELEIWLLVVMVAVSIAAVVLLLGSLFCIGVIIGLKKLVIDDFFVCFLSKLLHSVSGVVGRSVVSGYGGGASCCSFPFGPLGQCHG